MSPFEMWGSLISDATARLSTPVDCISRKKEECSSLCSFCSSNPSLPSRPQYIPEVCRNTLPSEIRTEIQINKTKTSKVPSTKDRFLDGRPQGLGEKKNKKKSCVILMYSYT